MKSNLRLGFLGSLFFHAGLIALLWFAFRADKPANGISADVVSTHISMEMLMATRIESEPTPELEKMPEPEKKEVVADPTKPLEKTIEKPKPKDKPKLPPKEKIRPKPKASENKVVAKSEPNPNAVVAEKVQAGNANINSQATAMSKSVNTNTNVAGNGSNTSEIAAYKAKLHREIERHKKYSQRARMMRLQGVVVIAFNLAPDGALSKARVVKSSGKEELDHSALDAVNAARSVGARPIGMGEALSVPISFTIR